MVPSQLYVLSIQYSTWCVQALGKLDGPIRLVCTSHSFIEHIYSVHTMTEVLYKELVLWLQVRKHRSDFRELSLIWKTIITFIDLNIYWYLRHIMYYVISLPKQHYEVVLSLLPFYKWDMGKLSGMAKVIELLSSRARIPTHPVWL